MSSSEKKAIIPLKIGANKMAFYLIFEEKIFL
jgi:hypothetical protein